jgi:hypothetical protein
MTRPAQPKVYHIVHVDRLPSILANGGLVSDAQMSQRTGAGTVIGMSRIKLRRLTLPVTCNPGTCVADYVPFYFCPRSIMLFVIHKANDPDLAYTGGQGPILHLEADLSDVVAWATSVGRRWAFSTSNAGAYYTSFYNTEADLDRLRWDAIADRDFRPPDVKEGKQAEFLVHEAFPWDLVCRIGVHSQALRTQVYGILQGGDHRPPVEVTPTWYY